MEFDKYVLNLMTEDKGSKTNYENLTNKVKRVLMLYHKLNDENQGIDFYEPVNHYFTGDALVEVLFTDPGKQALIEKSIGKIAITIRVEKGKESKVIGELERKLETSVRKSN
jgi:hypothetical protein